MATTEQQYINNQLGLSGTLAANGVRGNNSAYLDGYRYINPYDTQSAQQTEDFSKIAADKYIKNQTQLDGAKKSNDTDLGIFGTIGSWFQPQGQSGASTAGNVLSGMGTAVGIGSGLASMYYAKKQADLNKERAKMEKDAYNRGVQREAQAEARMQQFAKNAGNGAFYA